MDVNVMEAALLPHRFTSDEYHAMARFGILDPEARVELLDGQIVDKMTIGNRHMSTVERLIRLLFKNFDSLAHVRPQGSVHLSIHSEPEPDVSLLRVRLDDYAHGPALPEDVLALVEVADSSLSLDRGKKLLIYGQSRVADYWIVNLVDDCIEVYRHPHDLGYAQQAKFARGDSVGFLAFPAPDFAVDDILPPPKPAA